MRVLLITPPFYVPGPSFAISTGQPLGICYLAAALRECGFEVHLIDGLMRGLVRGARPDDLAGYETDRVRVSRGVFRRNPLGAGYPPGASSVGMSLAEVEEAIRVTQPEVVAISVIFTSIYRMGEEIARLAKRVDSGMVTVVGGTHATTSPRLVLADPAVDFVVTGEGERSLPALVETLRRGGDPAAIPGIGMRGKGGRVQLAPYELIRDLDALPMPAYDLLPMEDYFAAMAEGRCVKVYTSRGCPFDCSFCSVPYTSRRRFRAHSPERVVAEIRKWVEDYAIEGIMFEDDNMNTDRRRFRQLLEAIERESFGLRIGARNLRCDLLADEETLVLMKRVGFRTVWITPETGSQRVMSQIIGKAMKVADAAAAVRRIRAAGLEVGCAFVIGFPGETWDEIQQTAGYARKLKALGAREFWISIATPIEGTRMYSRALDMGLIRGIDLDRFTYNTATFDTGEFTAAGLNRLRNELMEELNAPA